MKSETKYVSVLGILSGLVVILLVVGIINLNFEPVNPAVREENSLKQFKSFDEMKNFLNKSLEENYYDYYDFKAGVAPGIAKQRTVPSAAGVGAAAEASVGVQRAEDYSTTNIQVKGVDEADIVKNDGKYIYVVSNNKIIILDAFPAEEMEIISEINFSLDENVIEIFVNDDKLIVFGQGYEKVEIDSEDRVVGSDVGIGARYYSGLPRTNIYLYDISNRKNPKLEKEFVIEGNYFNSRMIGDHVYVVSSNYVDVYNPRLPKYWINGEVNEMVVGDVYYYDYLQRSYVFSNIIALDIKNGDFNKKVYLTGGTSNIFVSLENIYLTNMKTVNERDLMEGTIKEAIILMLPDDKREEVLKIMDSDKPLFERINEASKIIEDYSNSLRGDEKSEFDEKLQKAFLEFELKIKKEREKTVIHKISVDELEIIYEGVGEVPGHILNQFSMDEFDGYFRIATTVGEVWEGNSVNNVYVLDSELEIVGKLEDLAKGEKIYSSRFIGDRVYLVTFKKVDPFFVIDLSDVKEPRVLGYLKIPGYSDYLHPYDENHIIGVGKEAIDASESEVSGRGLDFAWYQGLKIAIFDVSDVANPKESAKIVIGDRGTDSYALYEHRAFLFDKKRNLLVLPVSLAEIKGNKENLPPTTYGELVWQGAYVLDINENEIKVRGKITHYDYLNKTNSGFYGYYGPESIQRALYMDNVLYTLSQSRIKANELKDLREVGKVELPFEGYNVVISA